MGATVGGFIVLVGVFIICLATEWLADKTEKSENVGSKKFENEIMFIRVGNKS
jgi:hypothetical protein